MQCNEQAKLQLITSSEVRVDLYFHTFVQWASDWGWIEQTLNSRRSPPETEVFLSSEVIVSRIQKSLSIAVNFTKK